MTSVCILGAGSWGTALAQSLAAHGTDVLLWARNKQHVDHMLKTRENEKYLPGVKLNDQIIISDVLPEKADIVLVAVPTQAQRKFLEANKPLIESARIVINVAKGLEVETNYRLSEVYADIFGDAILDCFCALYGPSHAEEVGILEPTTLVAASRSKKVREEVQALFMQPNLRVYTTEDIIGVEIGGALKNIIALAIGMTVGLNYGDNARAALMTRGLAEISRLGVAMGANPLTFLGLTGVGDLIVTCTSTHSRNRTAGVLLGQGKPLDEVLEEMNMVVESVPTTRAAWQLSQALNVSMPITHEMYSVLFENKNVSEAAYDLMTRAAKHELGE